MNEIERVARLVEQRLGIVSRIARSPKTGSTVRLDLHQDTRRQTWSRWKSRWACLSDPFCPGVYPRDFSIFVAVDDQKALQISGQDPIRCVLLHDGYCSVIERDVQNRTAFRRHFQTARQYAATNRDIYRCKQ
jgi:hypothetical protein